MRDERDASDLILASANPEDREAAAVQADEAPGYTCIRQPACGQEEREHTTKVKGDGADLGRHRGRKIVRRARRQVGVCRRNGIHGVGRQQNLKRHVGGVEQRTVRSAGRARQQRVTIRQLPPLSQSLSPQVHEPPRIIRWARQRDADVDDDKGDCQWRQELGREIRRPRSPVWRYHTDDCSSDHREVDEDDGDEHPVEKIQIRG